MAADDILRVLRALPGKTVKDYSEGATREMQKRIADKIRVEEGTGCWIYGTGKGHPNIRYKRKNLRVARLVAEMKAGIALGSHEVRKSCGNIACVNPEHLDSGTDEPEVPFNGHWPHEPRISMVERVKMAQILAVERAKRPPTKWADLAKMFDRSERALQHVHARYKDAVRTMGDGTGTAVLDETLLLYTDSIEQLGLEAVTGETSAARVNALRTMLEAARDRVDLLTIMGRMPRSLRAMDEVGRARRMIRRMAEVLERRGADPETIRDLLAVLDEDTLSESQPVVEQRRELVAPPKPQDAAESVTVAS